MFLGPSTFPVVVLSVSVILRAVVKTLRAAVAALINEGKAMIDLILNGLFITYNIAIGVWLVAIAWRDLK